ncbi:MAG: biotin--[acetyl-CoA-carboxylase] ligase, partial [Spirochaetales bacterium]|nr:biotin--[acetyl-CoA-carboxylase] ligase [Spirochaetales bacterium]
ELKRRTPKVKTLLYANTQSGGRGRLGRSFFSPRGGVYFSLALPLDLDIDSALLITSIAAVATAEALSEIAHVETSIKWVNDLYLGDKKLCGILTEGVISMETKTLATAIIGIGINLHLPIDRFPADLQTIATSAFDGAGPLPIDPNLLVQGIVSDIERWIEDLPDRSFLEIYRRRSNLVGKAVRVHEGARSHPARVLGIDDDARLVIADEAGRTRSLSSGEVSIRLEG